MFGATQREFVLMENDKNIKYVTNNIDILTLNYKFDLIPNVWYKCDKGTPLLILAIHLITNAWYGYWFSLNTLGLEYGSWGRTFLFFDLLMMW